MMEQKMQYQIEGALHNQEEQRKSRCYNCKFSGQQFKLTNLTHLHCEHPDKYTLEKFKLEEFSLWDTLRVFNDTCENHQFKTK
jgi:hypothetical protein